MSITLHKEKKLWHQGFVVAGADEVGRGALAGPIVAAVVVFAPSILKSKADWLKQVKDSKKISETLREKLYQKIIKSSSWAVATVSNRQIDSIGIQSANILVVNKAASKLQPQPNFVLADYIAGFKSPIKFECIVKGDQKIFSIACASIVAKVTRDRLMIRWHKKYPYYKWDKNKGYGSADHIQAIKKFGLSPLHRASFKIN